MEWSGVMLARSGFRSLGWLSRKLHCSLPHYGSNWHLARYAQLAIRLGIDFDAVGLRGTTTQRWSLTEMCALIRFFGDFSELNTPRLKGPSTHTKFFDLSSTFLLLQTPARRPTLISVAQKWEPPTIPLLGGFRGLWWTILLTFVFMRAAPYLAPYTAQPSTPNHHGRLTPIFWPSIP